MSDDTNLDAAMAEFEKASQNALAKESTAPTAEQGSAAWLAERVGHCTASRFRDVLDFTKAGKEGAKRAAYKLELVIERITGQVTEHYVSQPMLDGIEREPLAKMAYEQHTGRMLQSKGFVHHAAVAWVGGSPDALVDDDGGLEVKCPGPSTHIKTLLAQAMPEEHTPQVQGLIWIFNRKWWDFESYCPVFDEPLRTFIICVPRDDDYIAELAGNVIQFLAEVAEMESTLREIAKAAA